MTKLLLAIITLVCLLALVPSHPALAQGTCTVDIATGNVVTNNCDTGFVCEKTHPFMSSLSWIGVCRPSSTTNPTGGNLGPTNTCANGTPGVQTDFGCLPSDPSRLAGVILNLVLGFAGALAILLIIVGGFKVAMSQGNPDALEDGRGMITQAILGLVFILLATTILGIIGIDILGLGRFFQRGPGGSIIVNP